MIVVDFVVGFFGGRSFLEFWLWFLIVVLFSILGFSRVFGLELEEVEGFSVRLVIFNLSWFFLEVIVLGFRFLEGFSIIFWEVFFMIFFLDFFVVVMFRVFKLGFLLYFTFFII